MPTVPAGGERLVTARLGRTVMLSVAVAEAGTASESVTATVKVMVPAVVGLPVIVPLLCRLNPTGSVPELRLQV
jgi:hypothetical protein